MYIPDTNVSLFPKTMLKLEHTIVHPRLKIVKWNIFISLKLFPAGNHFTCPNLVPRPIMIPNQDVLFSKLRAPVTLTNAVSVGDWLFRSAQGPVYIIRSLTERAEKMRIRVSSALKRSRPPSQLGPIPTRNGSTRPTFQLLILSLCYHYLIVIIVIIYNTPIGSFRTSSRQNCE
jgi:hypothetical protein